MTQSFNHQFKGFGRVPSECSVKIFSDDGENLICFEDLNKGTSVTNASEQLATEIIEMLELNPTDCRFFETYDDESYDEIIYEWKRTTSFKDNGMRPDDWAWVAKNPQWKPCQEEIKEMFKS
jgi:hypothetical protein